MEAFELFDSNYMLKYSRKFKVVNTQNGYIVENKNTETYQKISNKIVSKIMKGKNIRRKVLKRLILYIKKFQEKKNHLLFRSNFKKKIFLKSFFLFLKNENINFINNYHFCENGNSLIFFKKILNIFFYILRFFY